MVVSRKPKPKTARHARETLAAKFDRVMAEPVDAPFPKLTKREAIYFLKRLSGSNGPGGPTGDEIVKRFYGLWPDADESRST
jgi:hypothetical protein